MKIYPAIILSLFVFFKKSSAQQLSPIVISPSGGFYNNASGMLSFTAGELAAVETFSSPLVILTQGFQQYWDFGTYVIDGPHRHFSFGLYPNLSNGIFNLVTESEVNEYVEVRILDLLGEEIFNTTVYHEPGINIESIDITNSPQGMYLVALNVKENKNSVANHFIEKIQIVK